MAGPTPVGMGGLDQRGGLAIRHLQRGLNRVVAHTGADLDVRWQPQRFVQQAPPPPLSCRQNLQIAAAVNAQGTKPGFNHAGLRAPMTQSRWTTRHQLCIDGSENDPQLLPDLRGDEGIDGLLQCGAGRVHVAGRAALPQRTQPAVEARQHPPALPHAQDVLHLVVEVGLLQAHPMRGLSMQLPQTLPAVPEDDHVRRLLAACPDTFEGRRNRTLIALLAESGLRISEALRLRIEEVNFATRTVMVRGGKGAKDGVGFFGSEAAQYLRAWLAKRREPRPEDYLFVDRTGRSLRRDYATHTLHKLSVKTGLPRKVGPHALCHYAATSILKKSGDLEVVRQVLTHESLTMALRYAQLAKQDVSGKFRRASPLDNLRAGR